MCSAPCAMLAPISSVHRKLVMIVLQASTKVPVIHPPPHVPNAKSTPSKTAPEEQLALTALTDFAEPQIAYLARLVPVITCPADRRRCLSVLRAKGMTMLQESVKDVDQENIKTKMKRREPHARIVSRANIRRRKTKQLVRIVPRAGTRKTLVKRHAMTVPKVRIRLSRASPFAQTVKLVNSKI